ncbi:MAG: hypothetical protein LBB79_00395 [Prevotellaceae bacterium]|nr:hypothetical protein [Prevotellaceae bacterium]
MKRKVLSIFCCVAGAACYGEERDSSLAAGVGFWGGVAVTSRWGRPFWADMHSTITRGEVAYATNSPEYDWAGKGGRYRPYLFANLGADLPTWSGDFAGGKYGLSVTVPFMIDVWEDIFERTTAPVINTAYRFGLPEVGLLRRLQTPWMGVKNFAVRFSPLKHECTHIGDELTIYRKNDTMSITRVNVSYNYFELALTLNDPDGSLRRNHSLRLGLLAVYDYKRGWYNILPQEADTSLVLPANRPVEWYVQYQYQTNTSRRNFQGIASVELRGRERYNYPFSYSGKLGDFLEQHDEVKKRLNSVEERLCTNIFVGVRYCNPKRSGYFSKIGLGVRYYNGLNPYGQFRSLPLYRQFGVALIFE